MPYCIELFFLPMVDGLECPPKALNYCCKKYNGQAVITDKSFIRGGVVKQVEEVGHILGIYIQIEGPVEVHRHKHITDTKEAEEDEERRKGKIYSRVKLHASWKL
ncbi:MAG: hypothetical protein V3W19_07530 [Desulfatiglandales bacterium]